MYIVDNYTDKVWEYITATTTTISIPASVQNPPSLPYFDGDRVSYEFFTANGGTTVTLIGEEIT